WPGSFCLFFEHKLAGLECFCGNCAWSVFHFPANVGVRGDYLLALALAVKEEFDFLAITEATHIDVLTLFADPLPLRQDMKHRLIGPPGFVIKEIVLGKTAGIQDAEMGIDARPTIGRGLAAIIEPGPGEAAGKPGLCGKKFIPGLRRMRPRR